MITTKKEAWQHIHDECITKGLYWHGDQAVGLCGMINAARRKGDIDFDLSHKIHADLKLFSPDDYDNAWWGGPTGVYTPLRQTIVEFLIEMN